ncbi:MAG: fumarylacetoacetate hydrolase family protein [Plesiomonas sp.]
MYQNTDWQGTPLAITVGKVVCVGLNYADHVKEMGSAQAIEPVLFLKPDTALCDLRQPVVLPVGFGEVHHEAEVAVLISAPLQSATTEQVADAIWGYGIGLDLTLRTLQAECKKAGRPWEKAKAFDGSCPVSGFIPAKTLHDRQNLPFSLTVNGLACQQGNTANMLTPMLELISYMSRFFTLKAGDIILTGTPEGVGPLCAGDQLLLTLAERELRTSAQERKR